MFDGEFEAIPVNHESAQINTPPTISQDATFGHGTEREENAVIQSAAPVNIMATNPGMQAAAATGAPVRKESQIMPTKVNVMARSANQDGRQTDTPGHFIWGLQGEGDQSVAIPGLNVGKVALVLGGAFVVWHMWNAMQRARSYR